MSTFRSMLEPGGRFLARHLSRLSQALQAVGNRLRQGLVSAVGESAAVAVSEAVGTLLGQRNTSGNASWPSRQLHGHRADPWSEHGSDPWGNRQEFEDRRWDYERDDPYLPADVEDDEEAQNSPGQELPRSRRWLDVLSVGVQVAALMFRRVVWFPLLAALASGLIAVLMAWGFGPLAATAAALLSLAGLVNADAESASPFTRS